MPAASGWYPGADASGFSQTRRWQLRRRRAVSAATSAGSPRSHPSDTTITTPDDRSVRRAHVWLNWRKLSPMRVPPAQSCTASATLASARSRSRSFMSFVTRVRRVPNTNDSVRTSFVRASAWANRRSSREWRSMDPEMSQITTRLRGSLTCRRQTHSVSSPVARFWRNIARGARRRP